MSERHRTQNENPQTGTSAENHVQYNWDKRKTESLISNPWFDTGLMTDVHSQRLPFESETRVPQRHKTLISAPTTDNGTAISILMRLGTSLGDYHHPFIKSKARARRGQNKQQRETCHCAIPGGVSTKSAPRCINNCREQFPRCVLLSSAARLLTLLQTGSPQPSS